LSNKWVEKYWDKVARGAKDEKSRIVKWREAARNWLADYADRRASDFVLETVENIVKLKASAKVLDVGCGPGKWTRLFVKRCSSVTAIDLSSEMIRLAKESLGSEDLSRVNFHTMNVSELSFPPDTYDLVNCITVLQHIPTEEDWKLAVSKIVSVTKPKGKVLLYESAPGFVLKKRTAHMRIISMKEYASEFEAAGSHLVYWRGVDLSLPITFFGLKEYAASFNEKVRYFTTDDVHRASASLLSYMSRAAALLAEPLDYRLGETPLGLLSFGRLMLFEKNA
jgi:2-polyprenyl-3-methyl-5-hydroxy-6-metoxy-1,4-benzoquinol methylase